ncbi:nucleotide exchange factor [Candidatus Vidania fulgoroideae]|uniref:Nucleotide exchange factor n=1 Tax=Candidatus Vidania fulgoroideorum TaxID=881286 RepID=A0A346E0L6_9PROT|nr:nucleotide exchange factor [Candidatus Vidania fulgoroideae]WDI79468.1 nucleotide exchange factor GrpE [Candidatus Vidania fulgoroideae]WDR79216.1 nucleotide exchange factor GrpE [Candidatus Vidania fulgoroideae]
MNNFKQKYNCLKKENKKIKKNFFKILKFIRFFKKKKIFRKKIKIRKIIMKFIPFLDNINNNYNLYILNFLKYMVKKNCIKIIEPKKHDDFNPYIHQAIITIKGSKKKIIKVLKKGYIFNNLVLRPALVCI